MEKLLIRLKVIQLLSVELPITKELFIEKLKSHVNEDDIHVLSNQFDLSISNQKLFRGNIRKKSFSIMKRRRPFDFHTNAATAEGEIIQKEGILIVKTEINGLTHEMIFLYICFTVILILLFITTLAADDRYQRGIIRTLIELMLVSGVLFTFPYLIMRTAVSRMKQSLYDHLFCIRSNSKIAH